MLDFKRVRFKNFLSYGNNWTEFEFNPGINRIAAANAQGKSSMTEAVYFALFGKPYRKINLANLINSINKSELIVELEFSVNKNEYKIVRSLKPNSFVIYENDVVKPLNSSTASYQDMLEKDILHFDENVFNQTSYKSTTKNISFLSLPKHERRQIVEGIFGIEMFSSMNKMCKDKFDEYNTEMYTIKKEIEYTSILIDQEISNLENLKRIQEKINQESEIKVIEIEKEISQLTSDVEQYNLALSKIEEYKIIQKQSIDELSTVKEKLSTVRNNNVRIDSEIKLAQFKIDLFNKTCAGCEKISSIMQDIDIDKLIQIKESNDSLIEKLLDSIEQLRKTNSKCEKILANEKFVNGNIQRANNRISELNKSIYIETNKEIKINASQLNEHKENKKLLETKYNEASDLKNHYNVMRTLLSDEGIKAFIIKKHLPHINKLLNTYLQKFNADILFYFNEEFNEIISSRYKENFNYFNFSEGQKRRIDLAILFAFMEFSKMRNKKSSNNILILDEISSTLDATGENGLYDILRDLVHKENKSVITVSHSGNIDPTKIDFLYEVELDKGFSKLQKVDN